MVPKARVIRVGHKGYVLFDIKSICGTGLFRKASERLGHRFPIGKDV